MTLEELTKQIEELTRDNDRLDKINQHNKTRAETAEKEVNRLHEKYDFQLLVKERDNYKWEYENLCKFATYFEQQRDQLNAENEKFKHLHDEYVGVKVSEVQLRERIEHLEATIKEFGETTTHLSERVNKFRTLLGFRSEGWAKEILEQDDEMEKKS